MKNHWSILLFLILVLFSCQTKTPETADSKSNHQKKENTENISDQADINLPPLAEWVQFGMDVDEYAPQGLKVGQAAPSFQAADYEGNPVILDSLLAKGPVLVQFYRGQWCPVCTRYLSGFQDSLSMITAKGASVVAITPETQENIAKTVASTGIPYPVISDKGYKLMDAFKVTFDVTEDYVGKINQHLKTDIAENNGAAYSRLPVPATYIISQEGRITFAQFNPNYKKRASVKDLLEYL